MLALPIFPGRRQPSIVSRSELNYCVRNGNRWTLTLISTNSIVHPVSRKTIAIILYALELVKTLSVFPMFSHKPAQRLRERMVTRTGFEPMLKA